MTLDELGQQIKTRYPQYQSVPNVDLANKIIAKYPQYQSQITIPTPEKSFFQKVIGAVMPSTTALGESIGGAIATKTQETQDLVKSQQGLSDVQSNVLNLIHQKTLKGEDTSHLIKTLKDTGFNPDDTNANPVLGKSNKQILGEALGTAAEITSFLGVPGAAKAATAPTKGILEGAKRGAMAGAKIGGVYGLVQGTAQGLQANETTGEIIKSGLKEGVIGTVGGGILGTVAGGISSYLQNKAAIQSEKEAKNALFAITPLPKELTPTEYEQALGKGKITPKTLTNPARYIPSPEEQAIAQKYAPLLQSKDPVQNYGNIVKEIMHIDSSVGDFLSTQSKVYSKNELGTFLTEKLNNVSDITIPEEQMNKAKQSLVQTILDKLPTSNTERNTENLWKFRKSLDRELEKQLNAFSGMPTIKKQIARELRNGIQDFIANNTDSNVYKQAMKDMSELINLEDVLGTKAVKQKGANAIQVWLKNNPVKVKIGELLGIGGLGYEIAKKL